MAHPVVDARFCVQQPMVLVLKEKMFSLTGDSATIKDQNGAPWFKVNPKFLSLSEKRTVEDVNGQPAFSMRMKTFSIHNTWEIYKGDSYDKSAKAAEIKFSIIAQTDAAKLTGSTVKVYLNDGDKEPDYFAEGGFRIKKFEIFKAGPGGTKVPVGKIEKEGRFHSVSGFLAQTKFDAHTYFLEMQPGADAAFLTALAIAIDETFRDGPN